MILNCSALVYDVIKNVVGARVCHKAWGHQEGKNVSVLPSFTEHSLYSKPHYRQTSWFLYDISIFFLIFTIYFWLCWVFSLTAMSGGYLLAVARGLLIAVVSVVVCRPNDFTAYGFFPTQGWNPCSLHWQEDSYPLDQQGSPLCGI